MNRLALLGAVCAFALTGCVVGGGPGNYVTSAVYTQDVAGNMQLQQVTLGVPTSPGPTVYVVPRPDPYWAGREEAAREHAWRERERERHRVEEHARDDQRKPVITVYRPGKLPY